MSEVADEVFDLRALAERNVVRLLKSGRGIHAYALHRSEFLEREYPWNRGLVAFTEKQLGAEATRIARRDIGILLNGEPPVKGRR